MKNKIQVTTVLFVIFLLTACGSREVEQPTETTIPVAVSETAAPVAVSTTAYDPCSEANLPDEVAKVNELMREFDDYSTLASSTPQQQLVQVIPLMQEIRRRAESLEVPGCLNNLKILQINHMNTVIEILLTFMSNPQAENVNEGITKARDLHMQYDVEIASLLGLTMAPTPTSEADIPSTSDAQPNGLSILNPGPNTITLLSAPNAGAGGVATLDAGFATVALGQTADGKWIQVEVPSLLGQKAWVDASLVQVSGQLPVVSP